MLWTFLLVYGVLALLGLGGVIIAVWMGARRPPKGERMEMTA